MVLADGSWYFQRIDARAETFSMAQTAMHVLQTAGGMRAGVRMRAEGMHRRVRGIESGFRAPAGSCAWAQQVLHNTATWPHPPPPPPMPLSCAVICPVLSLLAFVLRPCCDPLLPLECRPLPSQVAEVVRVMEDTLNSPTPCDSAEEVMAEVRCPGVTRLAFGQA